MSETRDPGIGEPNDLSAWFDLFRDFQQFEQKVERQKARGLNDFNLLTAVLSPYDEVRLHSRLLASFLDPAGPHAQGPLFLDLFLETLEDAASASGHRDTARFCQEVDRQSVGVRTEHGGIDIYLSDGDRQIVIENKIHAADQDRQIERYIDFVRADEEDAEQTDDDTAAIDILVVYLTIAREQPSAMSLGRLSLAANHESLVDSREPARAISLFQSLHYRAGLLTWLDRSQEQVANLSNLSHALQTYREVVERVIGRYRRKTMSLSAFLQTTSEAYSSTDRMRMAMEIERELPKIKAQWLKDIMDGGGQADQLLMSESSALRRLQKSEVAPSFKKVLFDPGLALDFFKSNPKKARDRAAVWVITRGPYGNQAALALAIGRYRMHAGIMPLERIASGNEGRLVFSLTRTTSLAEKFDLDMASGKRSFTIRPIAKHGPIGLRSWSDSLETQLPTMLDDDHAREHGNPLNFASSVFADCLTTLAEKFTAD